MTQHDFDFEAFKEGRQRQLTSTMYFWTLLLGALPFTAIFIGFFIAYRDLRLLFPALVMVLLTPILLYTSLRLKRETSILWVTVSSIGIIVASATVWLILKDVYGDALLPALTAIVLAILILPRRIIALLGLLVSAIFISIVLLHHFELVTPFALPPYLLVCFHIASATALLGLLITLLYISMGLNEEYTTRLSQANGTLRGLINSIEAHFSQIKTVIEQLQSSSIQLNDLVERQASALSEISATINQIDVNSQQSVQYAGSVESEFHDSQAISEKGIETNIQSAKEMDSIKHEIESISHTINSFQAVSLEIEQFVNTITNIASNSQILSVNASVEAAKAGDYGRGFAVVAQEVRNLALQSQEATTQITKNIKQLQAFITSAIETSNHGSKKVGQSLSQMTQSGTVIEQLSQIIARSATSISNISTSAAQQSASISQMNQAMKDIEHSMLEAQTVSQGVEASAQDLLSRSTQLLETLNGLATS